VFGTTFVELGFTTEDTEDIEKISGFSAISVVKSDPSASVD
jgi:hypothetical protein